MRVKKLLAMFLLVLLLCQPMLALQSLASAESSGYSEEPSIVRELTELRSTDSSTFLRDDGTYECVIYSEDKFYRNAGGEMTEIDNSIVNTNFTRNSLNYRFANAANDVRFFFADGETSSVSADYDGHFVSFIPINANNVIAVKDAQYQHKTIGGYSLHGKNTVAYPNLFKNADFVYAANSDCLKEYIIMKCADAPLTYSFFVESDCEILQAEDGSVRFSDSFGECVFELEKLFAVDSAGAYTDEMSFTLSPVRDGTIISFSVPQSFISASERVFPVLIDPSVMVTGKDKTQDAFVSSKNSDTNYYVDEYLRTGRSSSYNISRTYIRFTIPSTVGGTVTNAYLRMEKQGGSTPQTRAYRVTSSWSSKNITWNTKPGNSTTDVSTVAAADSGNWFKMGVTSIVRDWVSGARSNYGFVVKDNTESGTSQWTTFYSSDAESPHKPELHITYTASPISIDRMYSTYAMTAKYRDKLQYNMNCYGYAMHVHATVGTGSNPYKQQPGEFIRDNQRFEDLNQERDQYLRGPNATPTAALNYLEQKMMGDFAEMRSRDGAEWVVTQTTQTASVPAGYRKIALTIGIAYDYHFYMRHSDGTWSHKPGGAKETNLSFDTRVVITDSNIATAAREGGYDDGVRYYLIKKSPIIDYVHGNGHNEDSLYTPFSFKDKAGDTLTKSATTRGAFTRGRFDFSGDVDCFAFSPAETGTYTFTTSLTPSSYDADIVIYDTYGNKLRESVSVGNPNFTMNLEAGRRYFIKIYDKNKNVAEYILHHSIN